MKQCVVNPILPSWEYIPDVEPRVFNGRLYLYGSHDRFGSTEFCANDYALWSAPVDDLSDWSYHGIVYSPKTDPANQDGSQTGFAPDCVQGPDGRYYLYYCLSRSSQVSVAVAHQPEGPFTYYGAVHRPDGTVFGHDKTVFCFDPGVLLDDGNIWLYVGFGLGGPMRQFMLQQGIQCDGSYCVQLEEDMLTLRSETKLVIPAQAVAEGTGFEGHAFYEASSPRKIEGRYYLVYSSQLSHELCYATADHPAGPYEYGGTLVSIGDLGYHGNDTALNYLENTHGGLVELGGRWAIFYHRQTNGCRYARQCCAEWLTLTPEGQFLQAEVTSQGLNPEPLPGKGTYEARIACNLSSAQGTIFYPKEGAIDPTHPYFTQDGPEDGQGKAYIANLQNGSWAGFKYFAPARSTRLTLELKGDGAGVFRVGTTVGKGDVATIPVEPSGDWKQVCATMTPWSGVQALYFQFEGTGAVDFAQFSLE